MKNWTSTASVTLCAFSCVASLTDLLAQSSLSEPVPFGQVRSYGGWTASQPASSSPIGSSAIQNNAPLQSDTRGQLISYGYDSSRPTEGDSVVYSSKFQTQGFEQYPSNLPPPLPNSFGDTESFSSSPPSIVPPSESLTNSVSPGGGLPNTGVANSRLQENVPSQNFPQPDGRMVDARLASVQLANAQQPVAGLRQRNDGSILPPQGVAEQPTQQFTTGLPFVTPAPGRYPTSPYMGPRNVPIYHSIGYQRTVPVSSSSQQPGTLLTAQLPQYQTPQYQTPQYQVVPNQTNFSSTPAPGIYHTGYQQCQVLPPPSLPPDGVIGQSYVPPTVTPNWNPGMYSANNMGYRPLISLGQENYNVVLGRGIIGQPTVYVPGQYIRNFLRYLSP